MLPDNREGSDSAGDESTPEESQASASNETVEDVDTTTSDDPSDEVIADNEADPFEFGDQRIEVENDEAIDLSEADVQDEDEGEVSALQRQLLESEAKVSEHWDKLLRLQAEMENQRKRAQNDVTKARKFALEGIVNDLLPVRDSLEMGLAAATAQDADPKAIVEGADLTLKMLAQLFEKNNIAEINPVDEKFDPEFHQAMSIQEVEGKASNTVTGVMQKGYTLNDRLVRPALVMVAK